MYSGAPILSLNPIMKGWNFFQSNNISARANNEEISIRDLRIQLTTEILSLSNELRDRYDNFELIRSPKIQYPSDEADPAISAKIQINIRNTHYSDAEHLSSMHVFERNNNIKTVFVTSDYGILNYKINLQNEFAITCSNPLYAVHNF